MKYESDEELRFWYGNNAVISRKRQFTFVHLDNPSPELVDARENFSPDELFACGCRTCSISQQNVLIVYMNRSGLPLSTQEPRKIEWIH